MPRPSLRPHRSLVLLLLLALAVFPLIAGGGGEEERRPGEFSPRIQAELEASIDQVIREMNLPSVAVGLWVQDVGSWTMVRGLADPSTGRPRSLADHHRIGSVTKTFTTYVILQLVQEGLLSLDDPVSRFFSTDGRPGTVQLSMPIPGGDEITLRQLGTMTSGLGNYSAAPEVARLLDEEVMRRWTPRQLVEAGIEETLAGCPGFAANCFAPGTGWAYSNTNTVLLGLIAEVVTGKPVEVLFRERTWAPYGLTTTSIGQSQLPQPFARGFTYFGVPLGVRKEATTWEPSWTSTAGDMVSTMEDMRIWGGVMGRGEGLSPAMQRERFAAPDVPGNNGYGFGVHNILGWRGHTGEMPGFNTLVYHRPDVGATLVIMVGIDDVKGFRGGPVEHLARPILAIAAREAPLPELDALEVTDR